MKYSIIVPVFNAESYLRECIDSVIIQSYSDFELILVDDGSVDSSKYICDYYASIDHRVKVLHKDNAGVSLARNDGLECSIGEWIIFLDADDTLHPHMLRCVDEYTTSNVDLIQTAYQQTPFLNEEISSDGGLYKELSSKDYCKIGKYHATVWAGVIKANIIKDNNLLFDSCLKLAEDQVFMFQVITHSRSCTRIPNVLYNYRKNLQSVTHTSKANTIIDTLILLEKYKKELPLGVAQFDLVTMTYIYDMIFNMSCPKSVIIETLDRITISSLKRCSFRVRIIYYLLVISKQLTIYSIRKLKKLLGR